MASGWDVFCSGRLDRRSPLVDNPRRFESVTRGRIARLHHGRDLGEPFDFLTWFELAPNAAADFEELVQRLRATEEWSYVEREIDIRLSREDKSPTD